MKPKPLHTRLRQILIFLLVLILLVVPGLIFLHQLFPAATAATATASPSQPELFISALNPGYTVDGTRDVGEFIELQRTTDVPLSLAGYSLRYTNASGKSVEIFTFADQSLMTGETLLLRLARTADPETADATYTTTLAMSAGPLDLLYQGEPIDTVCWTGQDHCADAFTREIYGL